MAVTIPIAVSEFLGEGKVATLSYTQGDFNPSCFICLFAFDPDNARLIIKSTNGSGHDAAARNGTAFAGTILPENFDAFRLKGLQFFGNSLSEHALADTHLSDIYYRRYSFARLLPGYLWAIDIKGLKLTSFSAGFSKKIVWNQASPGNGLVA